MSKRLYGKRDYIGTKVNKRFVSFLKTTPPYSKMSINRATAKLTDDLTTGSYTDTEIKQRLNRIIKPIEEMVYGRKKR